MYFHKLFFSLSALVLTSEIFAQTLQWSQTNGPYGGAVNDIKEDNRGILYAGTPVGFYSSSNSGGLWTKIKLPILYQYVGSISVLPSGIILAVGDGFLFISDESGTNWHWCEGRLSPQFNSRGIMFGITHTTMSSSPDTGITWNKINVFKKFMHDFLLFDDQTLIATADSGIYKSYDAGATWTYSDFSAISSFGSLSESKIIKDSKNNIYLMAFWDVFKSTDKGSTWQKMVFPKENGYNFYSISINKQDEILLSCSSGILYSSDYGNNWTNIYHVYQNLGVVTQTKNGDIYTTSMGVSLLDRINNRLIAKNTGIISTSIRFLKKINNNLICISSGGYYQSSDEGNSWSNLSHPQFYDIKLIDQYNRIFGTVYGKVYVSTDVGNNWQTIKLPDTTNYADAINSLDQNTLVAILDPQYPYSSPYNVIRTTDFGKSWSKVLSVNEHGISNILTSFENEKIYFGSDSTLYYSSDSGIKWQKIKSFPGWINCISVSPWGNVYVGTSDGLYVKELEGWQYIEVPYLSPYVSDIEFSLNGEMFLLGFDLYTSKDRGKSFIQLTDDYGTVFRAVLPDENGYIFLGTQEKGILKTDYVFSNQSRQNMPVNSYLNNNYPNPFNNQTTIEFYLQVPGDVKIYVYNTLGQKVDEILDKYLDKGFYKTYWNSKNYSSGIYFCRLQTGSGIDTKKLILLK